MRPWRALQTRAKLGNVDACLAQIAALDSGERGVNAFVSLSSSRPTRDVGVVLAVKDTICTSQLLTTCSSSMLRDFRPPYTATCVKLLEASGAWVVGKTNCDEFGMGSYTTHSMHGPVRNPTALSRVAGGSSGGSAAAVRAGMCDLALGTDTGGSVRMPASACGVWGFKPSYGRVSRHGVVAYADSLDCVGLLARDPKVLRKAFDILDHPDPLDPTSSPASLRSPPPPLPSRPRIGLPRQSFPLELSPRALAPLRHVLRWLKAQGAELVPVDMPSTPYALSAYYVIASSEAASNLARFDGVRYGTRVPPSAATDTTSVGNVYAHTRSAGFGPEVCRRILLGTYALTADAFDNYFLRAQRVRRVIQDDFDRVFRVPNPLRAPHPPSSPHQHQHQHHQHEGVDFLLHPTTIGPPPLLSSVLSAESGKGGKTQAYVQDILTVPASLAGVPALNVPIPIPPGEGGGEGGDVGVSVVGQWGDDGRVLQFGEWVGEGMRAAA